jgi:hypothetical protein
LVARIDEKIYRAPSGAKVFTVDPGLKTVGIVTRQNGRRETHNIPVDVFVKMAYGDRAAVIVLDE